MKQINKYSIVIPIFNESDNLVSLISEIDEIIFNKIEFEIIIVDDGSTDGTQKVLKEIMIDKKHLNISVIKNSINQGQSLSIFKGINKANFNNIITIDGDSQNDPYDIFKLEKIYANNDSIKLVGGLRKKRMDSVAKIMSSKFANYIRKRILNDNCDDTGCSLKIFDREIFILFPFFDGMHRFLPALFKGFGFQTFFTEVSHRKRQIGKSNYGTFIRLIKGIRDIIIVKKIISNKNKYIKS